MSVSIAMRFVGYMRVAIIRFCATGPVKWIVNKEASAFALRARQARD